MSTPRRTRRAAAITLAELLVAIGVVALLIGLALPLLASARRSAVATRCAAQLAGIGSAVAAHAAAHGGHAPLAGSLHVAAPLSPDDPGVIARALGDAGRAKHAYVDELPDFLGFLFWPSGEEVLPPPYALLGSGAAVPTSAAGEVLPWAEAARRSAGLAQWNCPADDRAAIEQNGVTSGGGSFFTLFESADAAVTSAVWTHTSYAANEHVGGFSADPADAGLYHAGRLASVRGAPGVVLYAEARAATSPDAFWTLPRPAPVKGASLADGYARQNGVVAGPRFDEARHRGRANVLFVDGHVEALTLREARRAWLVPPR